tara:strand:+ start:19 stop:549 length:531 start_codon:yes stop_codon:yes gene_type:complete
MKIINFNNLITSPQKNLHSITKKTINSWLEKFPYCEIIHQLDLLKAKENNDIEFDEKLKTTSLYSKNRKNLFLFINPNKHKNTQITYSTNKYSFSEWLKRPKTNKSKQSPKLISQKKINNSIKDNDHLTTETLAEIYIEQGHYERAIQAYEILCLKYPKKSSFFANQIDLLKKKIT